jgi:chemotaxis protein MotD
MSPNTSAVADAIAGEATTSLQPSAALGQPGAWTQAGKTLNTLKIQLHPIELGLVTATLRLKDDELQVELKVENGDAFRQLRDDQNDLVKALRAQGFAVDQVNIVFNSGGDTSSGGGSQAQAQAQAGQQGRERADGNGQGRQQRQDDSQSSAAERWVGNGGTDDAAAGTERSRTGHVYM